MIVLFVGASFLWDRYRPTSPQIEANEAWFCRVWYENHPTARDTAFADSGYWVVYHGWRRTPTCGELRREGKLSHKRLIDEVPFRDRFPPGQAPKSNSPPATGGA
jgi:hypothetical protein